MTVLAHDEGIMHVLHKGWVLDTLHCLIHLDHHFAFAKLLRFPKIILERAAQAATTTNDTTGYEDALVNVSLFDPSHAEVKLVITVHRIEAPQPDTENDNLGILPASEPSPSRFDTCETHS